MCFYVLVDIRSLQAVKLFSLSIAGKSSTEEFFGNEKMFISTEVARYLSL